MKLNYDSVKNDNSWKEKGFFIPSFDRDKMVKETVENPEWGVEFYSLRLKQNSFHQ